MSNSFDFELFDAEVKKQFGAEALSALDARPKLGAVGTFIPTSSEALNRAIGIGGIPKGRVIEIFGPESTGKTTLALDICAQAQAHDPNAFVVYVDAENALNPAYGAALGVDLSKKRFRMAQTNEVEEAMNLTLKAAKFGASVVVVDSLPTLELEADLERENSTEERVGSIAKPVRSALKKIVKACRETGTIVILINHITYKVGTAASFGNPETTPGGTGPRFYSTLRMDVRSIGGKDGQVIDMETGEAIGIRTTVKLVKNKVGTPFKKIEYNLIYGEGIDTVADLAQVAADTGVVEKGGAWYKFGEQKFNGLPKLTDALRTDLKLQAAVRKGVQAAC